LLRRGQAHSGFVGYPTASSVKSKRRLCWPAVALLLAGILQAQADDLPTPSSPPPFKKLRFDEDYAYLLDPAHPADYLDAIKFIPLNTNGDSYLTLGGEVRERYEYFRNNLWGRGPQDDDGYLLQRYMVHADSHFGELFRVFAQFKSGLEDGRNGGPRPTDRDDFDLHQAFFDARVPWSDVDSLTFRVGRQDWLMARPGWFQFVKNRMSAAVSTA